MNWPSAEVADAPEGLQRGAAAFESAAHDACSIHTETRNIDQTRDRFQRILHAKNAGQFIELVYMLTRGIYEL